MILIKLLNSIIIIVFSYILLKLIQYLLKKLFEFTGFDVRYENTLYSVLSSMSYYIIFITGIILVLRELKNKGILDCDKDRFTRKRMTDAGKIPVIVIKLPIKNK